MTWFLSSKLSRRAFELAVRRRLPSLLSRLIDRLCGTRLRYLLDQTRDVTLADAIVVRRSRKVRLRDDPDTVPGRIHDRHATNLRLGHFALDVGDVFARETADRSRRHQFVDVGVWQFSFGGASYRNVPVGHDADDLSGFFIGDRHASAVVVTHHAGDTLHRVVTGAGTGMRRHYFLSLHLC